MLEIVGCVIIICLIYLWNVFEGSFNFENIFVYYCKER